jgi:hypothetical protein
MIPIKDIKPNVEIIDFSFYLFILGIIIAILLAAVILFFIFRKKENKNLLILKNIDFKNPKKTAYTFSKYAPYFVNEKNKELFEEINKELIHYKYKPSVPQMDEELKQKIKMFIKGIK